MDPRQSEREIAYELSQRASSGREAKGESHSGSSPDGVHQIEGPHDDSGRMDADAGRVKDSEAVALLREVFADSGCRHANHDDSRVVTPEWVRKVTAFLCYKNAAPQQDSEHTSQAEPAAAVAASGVLAVGEPCAGHWEWPDTIMGKTQWVCPCGAKRPEDCRTETAKS